MAPIIAMTLKSLSTMALGQSGVLVQADFYSNKNKTPNTAGAWRNEVLYVNNRSHCNYPNYYQCCTGIAWLKLRHRAAEMQPYIHACHMSSFF
uniref:Putative secreted protein n=1 Tax=Amblyomma cajennense TaxID=34607 RepID=A0A023FBU1_AMBCJ